MTYLAAIIFPILVVVAGIAVSISLARFITEIRRDFREGSDG